MAKTKLASYELFSRDTKAFVYGNQTRAVQRMLDFDYLCRKETPSVAAMITPERGGFEKFFWGTKEITIPKVKTVAEAVKRWPEADVMVNFASQRSAFDSTMEAIATDTIRTIAVIAEGIPERQTRIMAATAKQKGKWIIGPATVGGLKAGCFKIGNTAGTMDNIKEAKLYRPGSVGFVSVSGGLSNEAYNIISRTTDGLYEGIAIGGDAFPGSTLLDHLLRYEQNPAIKMLVCLGELGGTAEVQIAEAVKSGKIKKPLVMWVTGTCAKVLPGQVQFGHAGAKAGSAAETADAKNQALRDAGIVVPDLVQRLPREDPRDLRGAREEGRHRPGAGRDRRRTSRWTTPRPSPKASSASRRTSSRPSATSPATSTTTPACRSTKSSRRSSASAASSGSCGSRRRSRRTRASSSRWSFRSSPTTAPPWRARTTPSSPRAPARTSSPRSCRAS